MINEDEHSMGLGRGRGIPLPLPARRCSTDRASILEAVDGDFRGLVPPDKEPDEPLTAPRDVNEAVDRKLEAICC